MLGVRFEGGRPLSNRRRIIASFAFMLAVLAMGSSAQGAVPPANDDFASAAVVGSLPFQDTVSTVEATMEPNEPDPPCAFGVAERTVWYAFTPGSDTFVSADTLGSSFDTVLAVWTGPDLGALQLVGCNDDALSLGAQLGFRAVSGTTYYIQAGGFAAGGSLLMRLRAIEAGLIEGTVTQEGTGAPVAGICVDAVDRDLFSVQTAVTRADGTYEIVVRSGSYLVLFLDFCDASDDHIAEWYDDVPFAQPEDATPVDVTAPGIVSGIDAELARGCPGLATLAALDGLNQVVGTPGPDVLTGTSGDDLLCGLNGADTLRGLGGFDVLLGAGGKDRLVAGAGDDFLDGGPGRDRLVGGGGEDFLVGRNGPDRLRGGPGNDLLFGGRGRDVCEGGPGIDLARGCEVERGVMAFSTRVITQDARPRSPIAGWTERRSTESLLATLRR